MAKVKGKNTLLELSVRRRLFKEGYRFRLFAKLPGKPDIVLPSRRVAIFVNGCFWHHHNCKKAILPSSNKRFWEVKLLGNKRRDLRNQKRLRKLGWRVITLWECKLNTKSSFERTMMNLVLKIGAE